MPRTKKPKVFRDAEFMIRMLTFLFLYCAAEICTFFSTPVISAIEVGTEPVLYVSHPFESKSLMKRNCERSKGIGKNKYAPTE